VSRTPGQWAETKNDMDINLNSSIIISSFVTIRSALAMIRFLVFQ